MICISLLCIHIHLYGKAGDFFIAFWLRFIKLDEGRKLAHTKWRKVVLVGILVVGCTTPSRNSFIEHSQYTHQQQSLCQTGLKREGSRQSGAQGTSFGLLVLSPWLDLLAPEFERKTAATNSIFPPYLLLFPLEIYEVKALHRRSMYVWFNAWWRIQGFEGCWKWRRRQWWSSNCRLNAWTDKK